MSVLRFLTSTLPKTDPIVSLTIEIFRLQCSQPEPPLSNFEFTNFDIQLAQKNKNNKKLFVNALELNVKEQKKVMDSIYKYFKSPAPSLSQKKYLSIIVFRGFCSLLFTQFEEENRNISEFKIFFKCLSLSIQYLEQNKNLLFELFTLVYDKILVSDYFKDLKEVLNVIQIVSYKYPELTSNSIHQHSVILYRMNTIMLSEKNNDILDDQTFIRQISITAKSINLNKSPDKNDCQMILRLLLLFDEIKSKNKFSPMVVSIIELLLSLHFIYFDVTKITKILFKASYDTTIFKNDFHEPNFRKTIVPNPSFCFPPFETFTHKIYFNQNDIEKFDNLLKFINVENSLLYIGASFGEQLNKQPFKIFSAIFSCLLTKVSDIYYNFLALLFLTVQKLDNYKEEVITFFEENKIWEIIFCPKLFNPKVPSSSPIINLRQSFFDSIEFLSSNEKCAKIIRFHFCNFLDSILMFPMLFTQILSMSYPQLRNIYILENTSDRLFEIIMEETIIQQEMHLRGEKNAEDFRIKTFSILTMIFQNQSFYPLLINSSFFCKALLSFMFEKNLRPIITNILENLLFFCSQTPEKITYVQFNDAFHLTFVYLIPRIDEANSTETILDLLNLFGKVVSFEPPILFPFNVLSNKILYDLISILIHLPKCQHSHKILEIILKSICSLQFCSNFNFQAVPFSEIAESIERIGLTDSIYHILISIISGNSQDFEIIVTPEAIPLLLLSVRKTPYYIPTLKKFLDLCELSICNRCSCLAGDVPSIILENIDSENFDLTLQLYVSIAKSIGSRRALFSFIRLFSSFENNILNQYTFPCLRALKEIIQESEPPNNFSLMQFINDRSFLASPPLSSKDIQNGFIVSAHIFLDFYDCGRYFFEFSNEKQIFSTSFYQKSLAFNLFGNIYYSKAELPYRKWFTLSIYFNSTKCNIYINEELADTIDITYAYFQDFKKSYMFHANKSSRRTYPLQIQYAFISSKPILFGIPFISNDIKSFQNWPRIFDFRIEEIYPFEKIELTRIPSSQYYGFIIRFYANFLKVFEASHSMPLLISLFAQIDYSDPNNTNDSLLENNLNLIFLLIFKSHENVVSMLQNNGFSILSYFLIESSPSNLTAELWKIFYDNLSQVKDSTLLDNILQWIVLNYQIWSRASPTVQNLVLSGWKSICQKWEKEFCSYVHFSDLLTIFNNSLSNNDEFHEENRNIICSIILIIINSAINKEENEYLLLSIIGTNNEKASIQLTNFVKSLIEKPASFFFNKGITKVNLLRKQTTLLSIQENWFSLYLHSSCEVCSLFLTIYSLIDFNSFDEPNSYIQYLIMTRKQDKLNNNDNSDKSNLVNSCRLMLQIKESTSLASILELEDIVLKNTTFFYIALSCAYVASTELNDLFSKLFNKICKNESNLTKIAENISDFSLFTMILWSMNYENESLLSSIGLIVLQNLKLFQNSIDIIDSLSITMSRDFSTYRTKFLSKILEILENIPISKETPLFTESLALRIIFRNKVYSNCKLMKLFESSPFPIENEQINHNNTKEIDIESICIEYASIQDQSNQIMQVFSPLFDQFGNWIEKDLTKNVIQFLNKLLDEYKDEVIQSLIILLFVVLQNSNDFSEITPLLDKIIFNDDYNNDELVFLLINTIIRFKENTTLQQLYKKILDNFKDYSKENFSIGSIGLNNYCEQPPASIAETTKSLTKIFKSFQELLPKTLIPHSELTKKKLESKIKQVKLIQYEKYQSSKRDWKYLWYHLAYNLSPFFHKKFIETKKIHLKRGSLIDKYFRPMIQKRNFKFDLHLEASINRDNYKGTIKNQEKDFNIARDTSFSSIEASHLPQSRYIWKAQCELIKIEKTIEGTFTILFDDFFFTSNDEDIIIHIYPNTVKYLFYQYIAQKPTAIEIFTTNYKSYLLNFPEVNSHKFVDNFRTVPMINAKFIQSYTPEFEIEKLELTKKWKTRKISTFEYLMWLNYFSGRSFNNLEAYPIFPWILMDYTSSELNLDDVSIYRDLSKPIGAINPNKLNKLLQLKNESMQQQSFLYNSTYSSLFMVLHLLIRQEPFTSIHIKYQDNKFDVPSRIFHSIKDNFERVYNQNSNFRELIPEFFFSTEFLMNNNNFDLGQLPNGEIINDVILPNWAKSAYDFVYKHRKALESEYVSLHINQWIDLIWGYKQTGKEAEKANNTFDPRLYPDTWLKNIDEANTPIINELLKKIGVIPQQLFNNPHPSRDEAKNIINPVFTQFEVTNNSIIEIQITGINSFSTLNSDGGISTHQGENNTTFSKERYRNIQIHCSSEGNECFAFSMNNSSELIYISKKKEIIKGKSQFHINSISCSCFFKDYVITGGRDSIIVKWELIENKLTNTNSLMAHAEIISCVYASEIFGIIVSCSIDGLIVISSASDFSYIMSIEIPFETLYQPTFVLVTETIGNIVVAGINPQKLESETFIYTYNLNGEFLGKYNFKFKMTHWCLITRNDASELLVIADKLNNVYIYDAYDFTLQSKIFESPTNITILGYDKRYEVLYIGTEDGKVNLCNS